MDSFFFRSAFAVFFMLLSGACMASEPEAPVAVNVAGMPTHVADRIRDHAAKGQTALLRYLDRTRMIHQLRIEDVVRRERVLAAEVEAPVTVATAEAKAKD